MKKSTLLEKLKVSAAEPAVSLIVPTDSKSYNDRDRIRLTFKNELKQLVEILQANYSIEVVENIKKSTEDIVESLDLTHLPKGVGIYAAPGFIHEVFFPFHVTKKLVVNSEFDLKEVRLLVDRSFQYNVLALSRKKTRLFAGEEDSMNEIIDAYFPIAYINDFQVQRSATHSLYNEEKSQVERARIDSYFRSVDALLNQYNSSKPLILIGTKENIGYYKAVAKHNAVIIAEIHGNHEKSSLYDVSQLVWPFVEPLYLENKLTIADKG